MITNRMVVMITHRLSAVQLADKVAVFENGGLIEYGTHKQLYEQGRVYAEMFDKQAQFYRDLKEGISINYNDFVYGVCMLLNGFIIMTIGTV